MAFCGSLWTCRDLLLSSRREIFVWVSPWTLVRETCRRQPKTEVVIIYHLKQKLLTRGSRAAWVPQYICAVGVHLSKNRVIQNVKWSTRTRVFDEICPGCMQTSSKEIKLDINGKETYWVAYDPLCNRKTNLEEFFINFHVLSLNVLIYRQRRPAAMSPQAWKTSINSD